MSINITQYPLLPVRRDGQVGSGVYGSGGSGGGSFGGGGSTDVKLPVFTDSSLAFYFEASTNSIRTPFSFYAGGEVAAFTSAPSALPDWRNGLFKEASIGTGLTWSGGYLNASTGGVSSWNDLTDKPSTFAPASHNNSAHSVYFINSTELADGLAGLVGAAPSTLNTLQELGDALGDDPNFATTIATKLGQQDTSIAWLNTNKLAYRTFGTAANANIADYAPITDPMFFDCITIFSENTANNNRLWLRPGSNSPAKIYTDYAGTNTESALILGTWSNNANQLVLATSGNVGIGTTTPSTILHIKAPTPIVNIQTATYGSVATPVHLKLMFSDFNNAESGSIDVLDQGGDTWRQDMIFRTRHGDSVVYEDMRIKEGNIGIGTTTPSHRLSIGGGGTNSNPAGSEADYDGLGLSFDIINSAYNGVQGIIKMVQQSGYYVNNADMVFGTATGADATEKMRITNDGNVGIGTITPDNGKLTILKNTAYATENSYGISIQSNTANVYTELQLGTDDTVDCGVIQTASKNTSWSTKKLALQPNGGNVGIGTTAPSSKLSINGGLHVGGDSDAGNDNLIVDGAVTVGTVVIAGGFSSATGGIGVGGNISAGSYIHAVGYIYSGNNIYAAGEITAYYSSDETLKYDIKPFSALDIINKLKPVSFKWNDKAKELNSAKDERNNFGLIAQEVEEVLPELIHPIYEDYKAVDYVQLIPVLIQAIKEQQKQINGLRKDLEYYKNKEY